MYIFLLTADNSSEPFDYSHTYTNVSGLFSSEQPADPFDTSSFDTSAGAAAQSYSYSSVSNTESSESVLTIAPKLDKNFIAELEKNLGKKEAQANTNNQVILAPPTLAPKKLNTERSYSAIPRPLSAVNLHTNGASTSNYSSAVVDMASFVPKYTTDPRYADNINVTENMVKKLCIDNIPSDKNINHTPTNYYRNDLYSNVKTDNLTVASNYSSRYYSPPLDASRYYSQTPNMYQIVPESNPVIFLKY